MKSMCMCTYVSVVSSHSVTEQHEVPQADEDKAPHTECGFRVSQLWKSHLRGSPIKATPVLYDVDRDGFSDILVASTTGELWAVHGESGHVIDNWPLLLEGRSFHGSPLLVSVRSILLISSCHCFCLLEYVCVCVCARECVYVCAHACVRVCASPTPSFVLTNALSVFSCVIHSCPPITDECDDSL